MSVVAALLALTALLCCPTISHADQSGSSARALQAGLLDVGAEHACAVLGDGSVRCWGHNTFGQLGYGNTSDVGDDEQPAAAGPVKLGAGRTARAVATGTDHTCALLDDGTVRCWGRNNVGQLGQGNTTDIGDDETPDSVPPVQLGAGRKAVAITAGNQISCALLDDRTVRCWGADTSGQLGTNGPATNIGDDETPAQAPVVGLDLPALAISASSSNHVCALLEGGRVGCWGEGSFGALGYGNNQTVGDDEDPQDAGYVNVGAGRTAKAISTGAYDSCAILDDDSLRCWGYGQYGRLGLGNQSSVGMSDVPGSAPVLNFGLGRTVQAVSAGGAFTPLAHACAVLDDATVRCWGHNPSGQLGYGNASDIGDDEAAGAGGAVNVGAGRTVSAIAAGNASTCALLDDGSVRCWGLGTFGRLGTGATFTIGDDEPPGVLAPAVLGGALTGAIGDASLTLQADAPARAVGEIALLTATLSSSGMDAVAAPAVQLRLPAGLTLVDATPSAGTFAAGVWSIASLPPGQQATLAVRARVTAAGALTSDAEVTSTAPGFLDVDSTPGNHVPGEDDEASTTIVGTVAGTGGQTTTTTTTTTNVPPVLSHVSLSRRTFAVGPAPTAISAARRLARGTALRFTLSERATVRVRIQLLTRGRRVRGRCLKATRARRRAKACTRVILAGTLTREHVAAGRRSIAFSGRLGGLALPRGRYRMTVTAADAEGLTGRPRVVGFTIRRR